MIFTEYSSKTLAATLSLIDEDDLLQEILVPVDFSECSDNAVRQAIAIAIRTGATVNLLHAVNIPLALPEPGLISIGDLEKEAAKKLAKMAEEITHWLDRERLRKVEIRYQVKVGFVSDEVLQFAEKNSIDMIVMGTHGDGGAVSSIFGSNASTVMQKARCPVFVIPDNAEFRGIRQIAFATDMLEIDVDTVTRLIDFARHFEAKLHILHILGSGDFLSPEQAAAFKERFNEVANYDNVSFHMVAADGRSTTQAIEDYALENEIEVMAIQNKERNFLEKLLHGSVSKKLVVHAKLPLIAFH